MEQNGNLVLTDSGMRKASAIYERHTLIAKFLEQTLGVDHETAVQDSCRMEHVISEKSFQLMKKYVENNGDNV
jgi:DtxR family transcriptional regulator, Mn-dependent transcriptional regulator